MAAGIVAGQTPVEFDRAAFLARVLHDEDMAREVAEAYVTDIPQQLAHLEALIEGGECRGAGEQAHRIKGASANIGALVMQRLAADLEMAGAAEDIESLRRGLPDLQAAFARLRGQLENL